jgi:hypothetical protein
MKKNSALKDILQEFSKLLSPLVHAVEYKFPKGLNNYLRSLDIGFDELLARTDGESSSQLFYESFEELVIAYQGLVQIFDVDSAEVENLADAAFTIKSIFDKLSLLDDQIPSLSDPNTEATNIGLSICEDLLHKYLRKNQWKVLEVLKIFNICKVEEGRLKWYWENVNHIFNDPFRLFLEKYNWDQENYQVISLLLDVEGFLKSVNLYPYFISPSGSHIELSESLEGATGALNEKQLRIPLLKAKQNGHFQEVGVALQPTHSILSAYKLYVFLYGIAHLSKEFKINDNSKLSVVTDFSSSDQIAIGISEEGLAIKPSGDIAGSDFKLGFKVEIDHRDEKKKIFSNVLGVALQHGGVSLSLQISTSDGELDLMLNTIIRDIEFQINNQFTDGFLSRILPDRGLNSTFDLNVGWSKKQGLHVNNLPGLKLEIPISSSRNSTSVNLSIEAPSNRMVNAIITVDYFANIGPLGIRIDKVGLKSALSLLDSVSGNLGYLDADFRLSTPSGIALTLKAQNFSGGGYLSRQDTRYTGVLQLNFNKKINLTAIGILDTELPDGQEGYSLLILITVEGFKPIPLGLGFKLKGVGGLLALNRSMSLDVLRTGIKDKTLNNILFPKIPVEKMNNGGEMEFDGAELISSLDRAFPQAEGRFVFGPMAKLEWGSGKALFELDIGLFIEVSEPLLGIAGALRTLLPDENSRKLYIQVNFLGAVDLGAKTISFDASLFASRLLNITLSGDMAVRMAYGKHPNFLLSVGGFHPRYTPPPMDLKPMRRIAITILDEEKARVFIQSYFAVTSNTVQVGARAEAWFQALSYDIEGVVGFDLLFQFNPFRFFFDAELNFTVKKEGEEKMSVYVAFYLEGPGVWIVRGTATFEILGVAIPLDFDKTFGQSTLEADLKNVDIKKLFTEELEKPENWAAILPKSFDLVNIKVDESTTELVFHPAGRLAINQRILPLNTNLQRFGHSLPNATRFEISKISFGEDSMESEFLQEHFAPTEFFELSNEEKLSRPSFEKRDSGIIAGNQDTSVGMGSMLTQEVSHERILIDLPDQSRKTVSIPNFHPFATGASVSQSPWSFRRRGGSRQRQPFIRRREPAYQVVHMETLQPFAPDTFTQPQARDEIRRLVSENPDLLGKLQIVPKTNLVSFQRDAGKKGGVWKRQALELNPKI